MDLKDRALGCILAGGCGDALGYPVEHKKWTAILDMYGPSGICNMETKNGVAVITDDTQMTIYTAQGLIHAFQKHCSFDDTVKEVHKSYLRWYISLMHSETITPHLYAALYPEEERKVRWIGYEDVPWWLHIRGTREWRDVYCG